MRDGRCRQREAGESGENPEQGGYCERRVRAASQVTCPHPSRVMTRAAWMPLDSGSQTVRNQGVATCVGAPVCPAASPAVLVSMIGIW